MLSCEKRILLFGTLLCCTLCGAAETVPAQGLNPAMFAVNNLWVMLGGILVFVMHLGFASVEAGLARAKNCTNILFKNTMTPAIGFLTYALCGFAMMYPGESNWIVGHFFGFSGFGLHIPGGDPAAYADGRYTFWTDFFFQGMFAATAATIVSGAVAERIKLNAYLIFTAIYVTLVYPVIGSWGWGGGFLAKFGFHDFAGSTFVHSVGGWGALAGVILLGPRIGKYVNGRSIPIMGHNLPLATTGVFLLWFGWFGFNGASALSADPETVSRVLVVTMLGASASLCTAMLAGKAIQKKPDLSMTLNGCLAGLVAVTAGADCLTSTGAILTGAFSGVIVVGSVLFFDRVHLDDPVGALSVHLVCGIFGTLAPAFFPSLTEISLKVQLLGVAAVGAFAFASAFAIFGAINLLCGLRVTEEEELRGLDLGEHGAEAYPGFQFFSNM